MELVGAVLNCGDWFNEAERLLDWGFENYARAEGLGAGEEAAEVPVRGGFERSVRAIARDTLAAAVCAADEWSVELSLANIVEAPVEKGARLGSARLVVNSEAVAETDLLAAEGVKKLNLASALQRVLADWPLPGPKA